MSRFPIRKKPVKKEDLLTDEEYAIIKSQKYWPLEMAALWLCGVRKPWADNEYPPYGPPGKWTYRRLVSYMRKAAENGEFETFKRPDIVN
jgi:hypothetical protein